MFGSVKNFTYLCNVKLKQVKLKLRKNEKNYWFY